MLRWRRQLGGKAVRAQRHSHHENDQQYEQYIDQWRDIDIRRQAPDCFHEALDNRAPKKFRGKVRGPYCPDSSSCSLLNHWSSGIHTELSLTSQDFKSFVLALQTSN